LRNKYLGFSIKKNDGKGTIDYLHAISGRIEDVADSLALSKRLVSDNPFNFVLGVSKGYKEVTS